MAVIEAGNDGSAVIDKILAPAQVGFSFVPIYEPNTWLHWWSHAVGRKIALDRARRLASSLTKLP